MLYEAIIIIIIIIIIQINHFSIPLIYAPLNNNI